MDNQLIGIIEIEEFILVLIGKWMLPEIILIIPMEEDHNQFYFLHRMMLYLTRKIFENVTERKLFYLFIVLTCNGCNFGFIIISIGFLISL
jgi:hypothetical protein